jgi:hypothetical protein
MAGGVADSLRIAGSAGVVADTSGPSIDIATADGETIGHGFLLAAGTEIIITLSDSTGINLTGAPGHRLEVLVDDLSEPFADLTDAFAYDPGTSVRGSARLRMGGLANGAHRLGVKAWDNANNSTLRSVDIEVTDAGAGEFRVSEFLNHPNPFAAETRFYFAATRAYQDATIRLFTLAGRLIWESRAAIDGEVRWDGIDADGDRVGNGIYLAQIEMSGQISQGGRLVDKKAYKETKVVVSR